MPDIRIAVDEDCPRCGFPELSGALPGDEESPRLLCRSCGWKIGDRDVVFVDDGLGEAAEDDLAAWEANQE